MENTGKKVADPNPSKGRKVVSGSAQGKGGKATNPAATKKVEPGRASGAGQGSAVRGASSKLKAAVRGHPNDEVERDVEKMPSESAPATASAETVAVGDPIGAKCADAETNPKEDLVKDVGANPKEDPVKDVGAKPSDIVGKASDTAKKSTTPMSSVGRRSPIRAVSVSSDSQSVSARALRGHVPADTGLPAAGAGAEKYASGDSLDAAKMDTDMRVKRTPETNLRDSNAPSGQHAESDVNPNTRRSKRVSTVDKGKRRMSDSIESSEASDADERSRRIRGGLIRSNSASSLRLGAAALNPNTQKTLRGPPGYGRIDMPSGSGSGTYRAPFERRGSSSLPRPGQIPRGYGNVKYDTASYSREDDPGPSYIRGEIRSDIRNVPGIFASRQDPKRARTDTCTLGRSSHPMQQPKSIRRGFSHYDIIDRFSAMYKDASENTYKAIHIEAKENDKVGLHLLDVILNVDFYMRMLTAWSFENKDPHQNFTDGLTGLEFFEVTPCEDSPREDYNGAELPNALLFSNYTVDEYFTDEFAFTSDDCQFLHADIGAYLIQEVPHLATKKTTGYRGRKFASEDYIIRVMNHPSDPTGFTIADSGMFSWMLRDTAMLWDLIRINALNMNNAYARLRFAHPMDNTELMQPAEMRRGFDALGHFESLANEWYAVTCAVQGALACMAYRPCRYTHTASMGNKCDSRYGCSCDDFSYEDVYTNPIGTVERLPVHPLQDVLRGIRYAHRFLLCRKKTMGGDQEQRCIEAAYEHAYYKRSMDARVGFGRNQVTRRMLLAETKEIDVFAYDQVLRKYSDTSTSFSPEMDTMNGYPSGSYLSSVHTITAFHEICAYWPSFQVRVESVIEWRRQWPYNRFSELHARLWVARYHIAWHYFAAQIRITRQIVDQFQSRYVFKDYEKHDPAMNDIIEYFVRAVPAIVEFTWDLFRRAENPVEDDEDEYKVGSRRRRTSARPWEMPPRVWLSPGYIDSITRTMHTDSCTAAIYANVPEVLMWLNPTPHFLHSWQILVEPKDLSNNGFQQRMRDPDIDAMSEYADYGQVRTISDELIKLRILFEPDGLISRRTTTWSRMRHTGEETSMRIGQMNRKLRTELASKYFELAEEHNKSFIGFKHRILQVIRAELAPSTRYSRSNIALKKIIQDCVLVPSSGSFEAFTLAHDQCRDEWNAAAESYKEADTLAEDMAMLDNDSHSIE
ncbi:hypothetical protein FVE85_2428 [Porphyridium purpureum]|uniref:Uncharacterized protein n=1 Tax=Porphyridium purpureum TaxID=35688 RepID=A0A5J4YL97_PORPP|nr:hypothetical protein FVE85_2428 [Porphyridium purpureum]|eukprot:POR3435..scf291_13